MLKQVEQTVSPDAVITSNSSSLSTTRLAESLQDPARFCGFHFFHPTQLTSVVEIITSVEEEFELLIPEEVLAKVTTVQDALTYLEANA